MLRRIPFLLLITAVLVGASTAAACTGPPAGGMAAIAAVALALLAATAAVAQLTGCDNDEIIEEEAEARGAEQPGEGGGMTPAEPSDDREEDDSELGAPRLDLSDSLTADDNGADDHGDGEDDNGDDDDEPKVTPCLSPQPIERNDDTPDIVLDDLVDDEDDDDSHDDVPRDHVCLSPLPPKDEDPPVRDTLCLSLMLPPEQGSDIAPDGGAELRPQDGTGHHRPGSGATPAEEDRREILDRMGDRLPDDVLARLDDDQ